MNNSLITLGHGSGGILSHKLISDLILPIIAKGNAEQNDAALLEFHSKKLAFTTDGYVVDPPFFPGGSIGSMAVHGTVNDLAMMGARPCWLSCALIMEEGLETQLLEKVLADMRTAADEASVQIVTGDTKVVPRGKADRIFITTSGIGVVEHNFNIHGGAARPGDSIILSGSIGDHGMAVMAAREGLPLDGVKSDSAPLWSLVAEMLDEVGEALHILRDPTRGGVATTLKELALQSGVLFTIDESALIIKPQVRGFCDLLGFDPLYVANEGKLLACVAEEKAEKLLLRMRKHPLGRQASIIGKVEDGEPGRVRMRTTVGGMRLVEMLAGEQLPRIC